MGLAPHGPRLDAETKAFEAPNDLRPELRLWLRLVTCTNLIEGEIRRRLRDEFDTTLPRFDLLAQLEQAPDGITLGELSRRMMVSNGNITGLVDRLVESGQIERVARPSDRRVQMVVMTRPGREAFARMAAAHEAWIAELMQAMAPAEVDGALDLLGRLKQSLHGAVAGPTA